VAQKLEPLLDPLSLSNINRFSKLFHYQNQVKICNNTITKDPKMPQVCRYTLPCEISLSGGKLSQHFIGQWHHSWLECIIQQEGGQIEHFNVKTARCDSYFRQ